MQVRLPFAFPPPPQTLLLGKTQQDSLLVFPGRRKLGTLSIGLKWQKRISNANRKSQTLQSGRGTSCGPAWAGRHFEARSVIGALSLFTSLASVTLAVDGTCSLPDYETGGKPNVQFIRGVSEELATRTDKEKRECVPTMRELIRSLHAKANSLRIQTKKTRSALDELRESKVAEDAVKATAEDLGQLEGNVATYEGFEKAMLRLIEETDLYELSLDLYAATVFSSLYRDPEKDKSIFSKSKPFLELDAHQLLTGPERWPWRLSLWTTLSLHTAGLSKDDSAELDSIDTFTFETGTLFAFRLSPRSVSN